MSESTAAGWVISAVTVAAAVPVAAAVGLALGRSASHTEVQQPTDGQPGAGTSAPGRSGSGLARISRAVLVTTLTDLAVVVGLAFVVSFRWMWGVAALTALLATPVLGIVLSLRTAPRATGLGMLIGYAASLLVIYLLLMGLGEALDDT